MGDSELLKVIDSLSEAGIDTKLRQAVLTKLEDVGVMPIPNIELFTEIYHQAASGSDLRRWQPVEVISHGWMRDGRALIKSEVAAKSSKKS